MLDGGTGNIAGNTAANTLHHMNHTIHGVAKTENTAVNTEKVAENTAVDTEKIAGNTAANTVTQMKILNVVPPNNAPLFFLSTLLCFVIIIPMLSFHVWGNCLQSPMS